MGYVLINVVKTEHLGLLMPVQTWSKAWPKQIIIILALLFGTDLHIMSVLSFMRLRSYKSAVSPACWRHHPHRDVR